MARWRDEIGERRAKAGQGLPLARVCAGVVAFYLLAILLNGDAVYQNAEKLPFGPGREASLRLALPLKWISRTSGFYKVREWIEHVWHKENPT